MEGGGRREGEVRAGFRAGAACAAVTAMSRLAASTRATRLPSPRVHCLLGPCLSSHAAPPYHTFILPMSAFASFILASPLLMDAASARVSDSFLHTNGWSIKKEPPAVVNSSDEGGGQRHRHAQSTSACAQVAVRCAWVRPGGSQKF